MSDATPKRIKFDHISKKYQQTNALDNINLIIPNHNIFVIVGPSGSGKTTLLKMINRLIEPSNGTVYLNQKPIQEYPVRQLRLKMGYVLQNIALFPNLTIYQNIEVQLKALHKSKQRRIQIANEMMEASGINPHEYGSRYPNELSGGQQQRIGIIRALAINPQITLMDEPFSALDPIMRNQLQDLVLKLHAQLNNTIVFITHDMNEAIKMGDQIAVLDNGKIIQIGTPEELLQHPKNQIVSQMFQNQKEQKVYNLIQQGNASKTHDEQLNQINMSNSIEKLALALKQHSRVRVDFNDQSWQINIDDFLNFIGHGKENHHE